MRDLLMDAIRYGERPEVKARLSERVDGAADRERLLALLEDRALARDHLGAAEVGRIREEMERAEARRLQPHYIESFFLQAFRHLGGSVHRREAGRYEITRVPGPIRSREPRAGCAGPVLERYERICFEKSRIDGPDSDPDSGPDPGSDIGAGPGPGGQPRGQPRPAGGGLPLSRPSPARRDRRSRPRTLPRGACGRARCWWTRATRPARARRSGRCSISRSRCGTDTSAGPAIRGSSPGSSGSWRSMPKPRPKPTSMLMPMPDRAPGTPAPPPISTTARSRMTSVHRSPHGSTRTGPVGRISRVGPVGRAGSSKTWP